jgi:broad specificity phosphatase PhoE
VKKLILVRHGNTFDAGDIILRVGRRTDLSLSNSGKAQAIKLGEHLKEKYGHFNACYASELKRTQETAQAILQVCECDTPVKVKSELNEVDYGIDDGRRESEVVTRIGQDAIDAWDARSIVPEGWLIEPTLIQDSLINLCDCMQEGITLVVTSNGIARFIDAILSPSNNYFKDTSKKLKTAAYAELIYNEGGWAIVSWNVRAP